jgi:hypothetical protein
MSETVPEPPVELDQIGAALAALQAELPTVPKAHTATVKSDKGSYSYTYAGLADVSEAALPLLSKHGLSFVTLPAAGALTGVLLHSSGQRLTASLPIHGSTPQQIGSSLTYMRRYLLGCMTGLVTDDDDDGRQAQAAPRAKRARAPKPPQSPVVDTGEEMTDKTRARMFALFGQRGVNDRAAQIAGISQVIGRQIESRSQLTEAEARAVIGTLEGGQ